MSGYLYETHMHTTPCSACGRSQGHEYIQKYIDRGYSGIIITDHFYRGNCGIDRTLPWPEFIRQFCAGYEDALIEGQKIGLDVFFAWEQNYEGDEYLIYGPDKQWLLDHPDIEHWSRKKQLEEVHKAGGAVIQAHPFRDRAYIKYILLGLKYCDGIEVANRGNHDYNDACALRYAREYHLLTTAGSDNHDSATVVKEHLMGVDLPERIRCVGDYARLILSRGDIRPVIPQGWFDVNLDTAPRLTTYWIDEDNADMHRVPTHRDFLRE